METYKLTSAPDFELTGKWVDDVRFDIYTIVDRRDKVVYNFSDSYSEGYISGFEMQTLNGYSVNMQSETFLHVRSRSSTLTVPGLLSLPMPIFDGDNFTVRNAIRLLALEAGL